MEKENGKENLPPVKVTVPTIYDLTYIDTGKGVRNDYLYSS